VKRKRLCVVATALVLAEVLASCSHAQPEAVTPTTRPTPLTTGPTTPLTAPTRQSSTTVARPDPAATLDALVNSFGPFHATSGVVQTSSGDLAGVSYNVATATAGTRPHVAIFAFVGSTWTKVTDLTLDIGGEVLPATTKATPITVVHLTGSDTPDFAVIVNYNDGPAAAIISRADGSWHALTFSGGPHGGDEIINPTFTATSVTERSNTCTPDCAAGTYITTTYRFSPQTGRMVAVG